MSAQDTVRWRETSTAIELEDMEGGSIEHTEEEEVTEFPGKMGPGFISVIVFTVLAAVVPVFVYAGYPTIISLTTSRGWAAFIGSWLALAFPPAVIVGCIIFYLPTLTCGSPDSSDSYSSERVPRSCCGKLTFWRAKSTPVSYESMGKYWWIGIGFTVATIIVEYILMIAFGVIVGAAIFSQVINGPEQPHTPTNHTGTTPTAPVEVGTGGAIGIIFYMSYFVAAFVEETAKFSIAATMLSPPLRVKHPHTFAVLLVIGTLGFATCENYFYVFSATRTGSLGMVAATVFSRFFISVPFHATTALWMASLLSSGVVAGELTFLDFLKAIWLPVLCHGTFDFSLLLAEFLSAKYPTGSLQNLSVALMFIPLLILIVFGVFAYRRVLKVVNDFNSFDRDTA